MNFEYRYITHGKEMWESIQETIKEMVRLIHKNKSLPQFREVAVQIVKNANTRDKNILDEAKAIFEWVRDNIKYVKDPTNVEMLIDPLITLYERVGDCDDFTTVLLSLWLAIGNQGRIVVMGKYDRPHHVYPELFIDGTWMPADGIYKEYKLGDFLQPQGVRKIYNLDDANLNQNINGYSILMGDNIMQSDPQTFCLRIYSCNDGTNRNSLILSEATLDMLNKIGMQNVKKQNETPVGYLCLSVDDKGMVFPLEIINQLNEMANTGYVPGSEYLYSQILQKIAKQLGFPIEPKPYMASQPATMIPSSSGIHGEMDIELLHSIDPILGGDDLYTEMKDRVDLRGKVWDALKKSMSTALSFVPGAGPVLSKSFDKISKVAESAIEKKKQASAEKASSVSANTPTTPSSAIAKIVKPAANEVSNIVSSIGQVAKSIMPALPSGKGSRTATPAPDKAPVPVKNSGGKGSRTATPAGAPKTTVKKTADPLIQAQKIVAKSAIANLKNLATEKVKRLALQHAATMKEKTRQINDVKKQVANKDNLINQLKDDLKQSITLLNRKKDEEKILKDNQNLKQLANTKDEIKQLRIKTLETMTDLDRLKAELALQIKINKNLKKELESKGQTTTHLAQMITQDSDLSRKIDLIKKLGIDPLKNDPKTADAIYSLYSKYADNDAKILNCGQIIRDLKNKNNKYKKELHRIKNSI